MGMIRTHHTFVATTDCTRAFKELQSNIPADLRPRMSVQSRGMNGYQTILIAPCGSKEGWEPRTKHLAALELLQALVEHLNTVFYDRIHWAWVEFPGPDFRGDPPHRFSCKTG